MLFKTNTNLHWKNACFQGSREHLEEPMLTSKLEFAYWVINIHCLLIDIIISFLKVFIFCKAFRDCLIWKKISLFGWCLSRSKKKLMNY